MRTLSFCLIPAVLFVAIGFYPARPAPAADAPAAATKPTSRPRVAKWTMRPLPADEVNLLAMGDWGSALKEQKVVAGNMASYVETAAPQFNALLTAGDNFYVQMKDEYDYQLQTLFEDMYDATRINFPWYVTYGNHDFERDKARIELAYAAKNPDSRWKFPSRYYRVDFPSSENPIVTALMLDSSKPRFTPAEWQKQIDWIDAQLSQVRNDPSGRRRWTVAIAHHPFFSNGAHGDNGVLQANWGPVFKKHQLDFYICGHDHDLQQLQMPDWHTSFVLAGGGGKKPTKMRRDTRGQFSRSMSGFTHFQFTKELATVRFVNGETGKSVHTFTRTPEGKVAVTQQGGLDKASTQPLRVLLGLPDDPKKADAPPVKPEDQ